MANPDAPMGFVPVSERGSLGVGTRMIDRDASDAVIIGKNDPIKTESDGNATRSLNADTNAGGTLGIVQQIREQTATNFGKVVNRLAASTYGQLAYFRAEDWLWVAQANGDITDLTLTYAYVEGNSDAGTGISIFEIDQAESNSLTDMISIVQAGEAPGLFKTNDSGTEELWVCTISQE